MLKTYETPGNDDPVPPECRATVERIQDALDGAGTDALDADPHATACASCRERVRAARVLLSVLAMPGEPVAVPKDFANRVVEAVAEDQRVQTRRRFARTMMAWALAAAILMAAFVIFRPSKTLNLVPGPQPIVVDETVQQQRPTPAPAPHPKVPDPEPAPQPRPIRFGDAVANTSQAILDTPGPFTDSVAVAPKVLDVLTSPFKLPAPPADPMGTALEPARKSLTELPIAARTGLEPVTGTAEKAFARFLRDVGSVKPNS
jgi:hypothetical protein